MRGGVRIVAGLGLAMLVLLVSASGALFFWVRSSAGQQFIRERTVAAVKQALAGHFDFERLDWRDGHLVLTELKLFAPDGTLVAHLERVEVDVEVPALLRNEIRIERAVISRPHLFLRAGEQGLNLVQAIEPQVDQSSKTSSKWALALRQVSLESGDVSYTDGVRQFSLTDLNASIEASVTTFPLVVRAVVDATATDPQAGAFRWQLNASSPREDSVEVETTLRLGTDVVQAKALWPDISLAITTLDISPELLQRLTGSTAIRERVQVRGTASKVGASMHLQAGAAHGVIDAAWNLEARRVSRLQLNAEDIDLSEWVEGAPSTRLTVGLTGTEWSLNDGRPHGEMRGAVDWKTPSGRSVVTGAFDGVAEAGALRVRSLRVTTEGAVATARGTLSEGHLEVAGGLTVQSLSGVSRVAREVASVDLSTTEGAGEMTFRLEGPIRRPALKATGQFRTVRANAVSIETLSANVILPDVTRPFDTDAGFVATNVRMGERAVGDVNGAVVTHGREVDAVLALKGLEHVTLHATASIDRNRGGADITSARVETGVDTWILSGPTRVRWSPSIQLEPFVLTAGSQRLSAEGTIQRGQMNGLVRVAGVELARLPRVLVPTSLGIGGVLDAEVVAMGRVEARHEWPEVTAKATLRDGSMAQVAGVNARLDATLVSGRLSGALESSSALGRCRLRVDIPIDALTDSSNETLGIDAEIEDLNLESLQRWRGASWPVEGLISASLTIKGPANDPAVSFKANATRFAVVRRTHAVDAKKVFFEPLTLSVESGSDGTLQAMVAAQVSQATVASRLKTALTVASLRKSIPTFAQLRATSAVLSFEVIDFSLESLASAGVQALDEARGRGSIRGRFSGSLDEPRGTVALTLNQVKVGSLQDIDGVIELTAADTVTTLSGKGRMANRPLFDFDTRLDAPVRVFERDGDFETRPLTGHLTLASIPLSQVLPARDDELAPRGQVSLELSVKGSLAAPAVILDAAVQNLAFGKVALGHARLISKSTGRVQDVGLTLRATNGSMLRADGTVGLDLSMGSFRKGVRLQQLPLDVAVNAKAFDVGFVSGVTPLVRTVGGFLDVDSFRIQGSMEEPQIRGRVGWNKGRLALASFGDFRDIDVDLKITSERIEAQTFSVRAGSGGIALERTVAQKRSPGLWSLSTAGAATRFPVVNEDQLAALLSGKFAIEGDLSNAVFDFSRVEVSRLDVELPDIKRKDIQDLDRPADVVLVREGKVVSGRRKADAVVVARPSRTYSATVIAPKNVWIRSSDVNLELGLSEGFRVEHAGSTQVFGEARVLGGRIDVIGREFRINRSTAGDDRTESSVRFAGPATEPYVNVTATHTNEREKVIVTVSVVGRGRDVSLKVTSSDPQMSESDIYTLLATGRRDLRRSSGSSMSPIQAASVLGSFVLGEIKTAALKKLPIDLVDVISVDTRTEDLTSARFEVGKYLSDSLYLGYTFQPGANRTRGESTHTGRLEFQVSKGVSVEATAAVDAPAAGVDIVFGRDF